MTVSAAARSLTGLLYRHRLLLLGAVALLCLADVARIAAMYLAYPGYVDHAEPSIVTASWRIFTAHPVYHSFGSEERLTNLYGPYVYSLHALVLALLGPSVAAGKLPAVLAVVVLPLVVAWSQRRHGLAAAFLGLSLAVGFALKAIPASLWNRPDVFLVLVVAVAVAAMGKGEPGRPRDMILAVCAGLAVSMKIHAGIYFMPIILYRVAGRGIRPLIEISVVAAVVAVLPFALPVFPPGDFLSMFGHIAGKPTSAAGVWVYLYHAAFHLGPVLLLILGGAVRERLHSWPEKVYLWSYLGCFVLLLPLAAKPGAGAHYLFPLTAITIDILLRHTVTAPRRRLAWGGAVVLTALVVLVSIPIQKRFLRSLNWDISHQITADIREIMARYPGRSIEMGVGTTIKNYHTTYYKTLLVLANHPYYLDAATVGEMHALGIPMAPATITRIATCADDLWLIPKGEPPFGLYSFYGGQAFDESFREAFVSTHDRKDSSEFFDIWGCVR